MIEKEKMLRGKFYKFFEEILLNECQYVKELFFDFNVLRLSEIKKRNDIIKNLFGKIGESFFIELLFCCDYGYNIEIGENFYFNYNCIILDCVKVIIGNNVFLVFNVGIYIAGYLIYYEFWNEEYEYVFLILIGNNVWIGGNIVINLGVNVGDNCVIGFGSVIMKDILVNCIVVGNFCRVICEIIDEDKNYYFKKLKFENED